MHSTYESKREDGDSRDGMGEHTPAENVHMSRTHVQIPQEVAQGKALQQSTHTIVSPNALFPHVWAAPGLALLIEEDDVQAQGVDEAALHEGDDVHIPADPGSAVEVGIGARAQAGRDEGRNDVGDEYVETEGEDDLMGVQRQSRQSEDVGDTGDGGLQGLGRLDGVGVEHGGAVVGWWWWWEEKMG